MPDRSTKDKSIFLSIAKYAQLLGVSGLSRMRGCWEFTLPPEFEISVNGHREVVRDRQGADVPAFSAYVRYHGWPCMIADPYGEAYLTSVDPDVPTSAERLRARLEAAIATLRAPRTPTVQP